MTETAKKRGIELAISVGLPLVGLLLLLGDHTGVFDHWRGLDKIEEVANRFDLSYATYASFPVYPEDAEWKPTIALIEKYSNVKWLAGRQPQRIARIQAQLSTHDQGGYEWTAPSTPVAVFFRRWPSNNGAGSPPQDWRSVGSIGDLHDWIAQSKSEFRFWLSDIFLVVMAAILGYWLWRVNYVSGSTHRHRN